MITTLSAIDTFADPRFETESLPVDTAITPTPRLSLGLPEPVARYIEFTRGQMRRPILRVTLKQAGLYRVKPNTKWRPLEAQLLVETSPPKRVWNATIKRSALMALKARDSYVERVAVSHTERFSLLPTEHASGAENNLSGLAQILAEMPLSPTAMLPGGRIQWEAIDANTARATIYDRELFASGIFHFDHKGRIHKFTTEDRFRLVNGKFERTSWAVAYRDYVEFGNVKIPMRVRASWLLDNTWFNYTDYHISNIKFHQAANADL
jgi:hypothetical protein